MFGTFMRIYIVSDDRTSNVSSLECCFALGGRRLAAGSRWPQLAVGGDTVVRIPLIGGASRKH